MSKTQFRSALSSLLAQRAIVMLPNGVSWVPRADRPAKEAPVPMSRARREQAAAQRRNAQRSSEAAYGLLTTAAEARNVTPPALHQLARQSAEQHVLLGEADPEILASKRHPKARARDVKAALRAARAGRSTQTRPHMQPKYAVETELLNGMHSQAPVTPAAAEPAVPEATPLRLSWKAQKQQHAQNQAVARKAMRAEHASMGRVVSARDDQGREIVAESQVDEDLAFFMRELGDKFGGVEDVLSDGEEAVEMAKAVQKGATGAQLRDAAKAAHIKATGRVGKPTSPTAVRGRTRRVSGRLASGQAPAADAAPRS